MDETVMDSVIPIENKLNFHLALEELKSLI